MTDGLHVEIEGRVMILTLDRPKANAIDSGLSQALGNAFTRYRDDPSLCCAIVTAAGEKFFSAGWDLKAAAENKDAAEDYGPGGFAGITELFDLDKPVIAAVNGMAVGGGFEIVLCCDVIVADEHAQFFLPEVKVGVVPDGGGMFRLPRRVPESLALEMLLTGRRLSSDEALRLSLVNRVTAKGGALAKAKEIAAEILQASPKAIRAVKQAHRLTRDLSVEQAYRALRSGGVPAYDRLRASKDYWEGAAAFSEKREPKWEDD
ncbi:enoyl-CoA hydratase-related protein [Dongia deserti]|uniref:enoyl-CoA hydratase-related protein n=1 Tax=Dongia deserti TaxID=2268030 RepID=UPI000E65D719|nr:enoyl-CoA hydratase-related protein [Dongia deserti]